MNVLFVHFGDDWITGSEVSLLETMRGLMRKGVEPVLWCNAPAMQAAAENLGIVVHRDDFKYYFDYSSPPFSLKAWRAQVRKGRRLIAETGAELVHCNSAAPAQWMAPACRRARIPLLVNMHARYLRRSRYVLGLHLADQVVAVAAAATAPLLAEGMAAERVTVVHNGFDPDAVLAGDATGLRAELGIPADATVGAIAGSLIHLKGHDILFDAMRALDPSRLFHLLVIGDGPEREAIRQKAQGLPAHFLGYRTDLGAILRDNADMLIAPSRQEAFGRVIVEAAFGGVPAIGTRVDGIPEAIAEDVTGLLVPPESPLALRDAIERLIDDPALRRDLGAAAQRRAYDQFTIERCAEAMLGAYRTTLARYEAEQGRFRLARLEPYWRLLARRGGPPS